MPRPPGADSVRDGLRRGARSASPPRTPRTCPRRAAARPCGTACSASEIQRAASSSSPSAVARWARASATAALPRRPCPVRSPTLRHGQVGARAVEIADVGAGDRGRHREHHVANRAAVVLPQRRLGLLDHVTRGPGASGGGGSWCRRCAAAGARLITDQRASGSARSSSSTRLLAVALGQPHLGQPLQAVRLAAGRVDRRGAGPPPPGQLALGALEVALEQRRLADQGRGERHAAQRAVLLRAAPQAPRRARSPRRRASGRRAGTPPRRGARRTPRWPGPGWPRVRRSSQPEPLEPLAPLVRDQSLQRDQVDHLPRVVGAQERSRLRSRPPTRCRCRRGSRPCCRGRAGSAPSAASPSISSPASAARRGLQVALRRPQRGPAGRGPAGARCRSSAATASR